jgi:Uri superfamily endonuclease
MIAPSSGGTYILLIESSHPATIGIGTIGNVSFKQGTYAYVGSAHGPGGLAARLGRYEVGPRSLHWHIDYLLQQADVVGALYRADDTRRECSWARRVAKMTQGCVPGFGSSDCRCQSHLFFVGGAAKREELARAAGCELKACAATAD